MALHFSLPGLMSLLALVNPDSAILWRTSFAIVAIGGAVVLIVLRGAAVGEARPHRVHRGDRPVRPDRALVIAPGLVGDAGIEATPVRVEAVLDRSVFAGVNVAGPLFEEAPASPLPRQVSVAQQASRRTTLTKSR